MNRRQFIKALTTGAVALVVGVDLAKAGTKDESKSVQVVSDQNGTAWVSKTSDEVIRDVEVTMNGMKCKPWSYEEIIIK